MHYSVHKHTQLYLAWLWYTWWMVLVIMKLFILRFLVFLSWVGVLYVLVDVREPLILTVSSCIFSPTCSWWFASFLGTETTCTALLKSFAAFRARVPRRFAFPLWLKSAHRLALRRRGNTRYKCAHCVLYWDSVFITLIWVDGETQPWFLPLCFHILGNQRAHDLTATEASQHRAEDPPADQLQAGRGALDRQRSSGENIYV